MEYNLVELAKKEAKNGNQNIFLKKQIHSADAGKDKSGLVCSGEQTHAFILFDKSKMDIINRIIDILNRGENGALILNQNGIQFDEKETLPNSINYQFTEENSWEYSEQIGVKPVLYIFGAGHVSLPLSQVFRVLDFKVVLLDDREGLSTFESNEFAHQKMIINYKDAASIVEEGTNSYVVIMTVGHKSDAAVLKQLVTKNLKYLGMIGSKNKVNSIYESLKSEGISESDLAKVDSPIGLSINSKTTAEIAISIAAKVIQIKNC